jgi:uncharacterized membrane protein YidH (DUF202 family)
MSALRILGIVLIVGGILGLAYGGFSYTKEEHSAKIGPITLSVSDKERVNVPLWVGIGAVAVGGLILVLSSRKG